MDVHDELKDLTVRFEDDLGLMPWASEVDRWLELLFCILNSFVDDAVLARDMADLVQQLGLAEPAKLAEAADETSTAGVVLRHILRDGGLADEDVAAAARVLSQAGTAVQEKYEGCFQLGLRRYATVVRDGIAADLSASQPDARLTRAVTHWLQNTSNMPLSMASDEVVAFCRERGLSVGDIETAADRIGLNVAVVDDVIALANKAAVR